MKNTDNLNGQELQSQIDFLSELMLPQRYEVIKNVLSNRTDYITVGLENIFHSQNASAIMRSCEAFGIQNIHVVETLCPFKPNVDVVKGSDKWLDLHRHQNTEELVGHLKNQGYRIVSTSPHQSGVCCEDFDITKGKTAIFFGTEKAGISDKLIELSDEFITIPMYGFVESLNVSVCSAIALQSLTRKLHQSDIDWGLSEEDKLKMLNRWMRYSVKDSERILKRRHDKK